MTNKRSGRVLGEIYLVSRRFVLPVVKISMTRSYGNWIVFVNGTVPGTRRAWWFQVTRWPMRLAA